MVVIAGSYNDIFLTHREMVLHKCLGTIKDVASGMCLFGSILRFEKELSKVVHLLVDNTTQATSVLLKNIF